MTPLRSIKPAFSTTALVVLAIAWVSPMSWAGVVHEHGQPSRSLSDPATVWPSLDDILRVVLLRDYNTRLVVISTVVLGAAAGLIGMFLLLRKRSLMGDALSHATLPGIAVAFMVMAALGGSGKWFVGLLIGAAVAGLIGVGCVLVITRLTRLKEDTAMGVVLSVFFGLGTALLGVIQSMPQGNAAGLESFIYGKTASMVYSDFLLVSGVCVAVVVICGLFFKELRLLCFDEGYAHAQGSSIWALDVLMLAMVTAVTVVGLQAVGLILIIALLIIPPAAARFWSDRLAVAMPLSAGIGAVSGWLGASISALTPDMPAGAVIVLVGSVFFILSMVFGSARGVWVRVVGHRRLIQKVGRQHLLRAVYEISERAINKTTGGGALTGTKPAVSFEQLLAARSWSGRQLRGLLSHAQRQGWIETHERGSRVRLTDQGAAHAARVVRNHRLWEMYLITHADIAPSHVDRDADQIEHVLSPGLIAKLEKLLKTGSAPSAVPPSPHAV